MKRRSNQGFYDSSQPQNPTKEKGEGGEESGVHTICTVLIIIILPTPGVFERQKITAAYRFRRLDRGT